MIRSTFASLYADTRQVGRIVWHRLAKPGCGPDCRTVCDHELAMSALRRLGRCEEVTGPPPPPGAGRLVRPTENRGGLAPGVPSPPGRSSLVRRGPGRPTHTAA